MPYIEEIARWQDNPEYNALSAPRKQVILENYFDKNISNDEFLKLPAERKSKIKSKFVAYHTVAPEEPIQPESTLEATGRVLGAGLKGAAEGLTTELPSMAGRAMEFVGSGIPGDITATMRETTAEYGGDPSRVPTFEFDALRKVGEDLKDWAELKRQQWFGPPKKREGLERVVYEGSKMLAPSVLPAAIVGTGIRTLKGVGGLVKAAKAAEVAGDVARAADLMDKANKAANLANRVASVTTASMFGLSQAQQTRDTAEEQAVLLESQGKFEEAKEVRAYGQGIAPFTTGTIEAAGEYFGTKYLGKLFRLDEAGVAKRGAKNLARDFLKTLGVEVSTEVGQQLGEAQVEKVTGIRPEADPLAEALDVVGPTAFMTLLTGGAAGAIDITRQPTDSIDVLQEEQKKITPDKDVVNVELIKKTLKESRVEEALSRARQQRMGLQVTEIKPAVEEAAPGVAEAIKPPAPIPTPKEEEIKAPLIEETITRAANEAATSPTNDKPQPTEAQKESGNFAKGHVKIQGMDITIENPKGSERTGKDSDGETWSTTMKSHYGYIKSTVGKDKAHIDIFIGDHPDKESVYVVDQINPDTGEFDEHKALIGFGNMRAARKGYLENYEKGWKGLGAITKMSVEEFKAWSGDKAKTKEPLKYKARDKVEKYSIEAKVSPIGFYSAVQEAVDKMDFKKIPAQDLANRIKNVQGLKQEELEHLGVTDWLEGMGKDKVTREQVQAFIEQGGVKIEEVRKGFRTLEPEALEGVAEAKENVREAEEKLSSVRQEIVAVLRDSKTVTEVEIANISLTLAQGLEVHTDDKVIEAFNKLKIAAPEGYDLNRINNVRRDLELAEDALEVAEHFVRPIETKFSQYTLPGGENYREVLLRLPTKLTPEELELHKLNVLSWERDLTEEEKRRGDFLSKKVQGALSKKLVKETFQTPHFDEPNVLAHFRLDDRVDSEGRKTLFIEEIQSDWHQKGRKAGYKGTFPEQRNFSAFMKERNPKVSDETIKKEFRERKSQNFLDWQAEYSEAVKGLGAIPDAPFKTSWPLLAFKRVLRMAAEQGYDAVAWTPGDVQADRYDLSKQISRAGIQKRRDGKYNLVAEDLDGKPVITEELADIKKLEDYVGKDVAKRIVDAPLSDDGFQWVSGEGLKVGGEGMKTFYDKMLPNVVGKYARKLDKAAKVETTEINTGTEKVPAENVRAYARLRAVEVWSLPLTDKLKQEVLQGQPLFRVGKEEPSGITASGKKLRESIPYVGEEKRVTDKPFAGPEKRAQALQKPLTEAEREKIAKEGKYPAFPGEVPRTIDLVKTVFPGQDIKETKSGFEVTLKNKLKVQVDRVAEIVPEAKEKPTVSEGEYIAGVYVRSLGAKPLQIKLSTKAGVTTLHHESIHLLEDFGIITKQEAGRINRHIKQAKLWDKGKNAAENRAEWLANEVNKPADNTKMGRIWAKIKDFIGNLVNKFGVRTVGGVVREIKTGKVFERPADIAKAKPSEKYKVEREGTPTEEDIDQPSLLRRQFDELVYNMQDKFNYLNKEQQKAERRNRAELPEEQDAYLAETRYHGMAAAAIEDFQEEYVDPMLEIMSSNDINIDQADEYLHARHAKEANARLKEINPDREDNEALSGMTDSEADVILNRIASSPKAEAFQSLGEMVDQVTKAQRDILVSSGLENAETVKDWEKTYKYYVPLMREGKAEGKMPRRGRGFDIRGKQPIRAGSTRAVVNILAHAVANTEAAMIRAEKAKVSRAFLAFAQENLGPWKIDKVEYKAKFNNEGMIEYRPDPLYRTADNVLIVKKDGVNHRIVFDESNFNAMRIASAMKNLDAQGQGELVRILSKTTRWLAMINTSLNPEFIISNFFRDIQTAGYNMSDSAADKIRFKAFKEIKSAWRGIRDFQQGRKNTEWAKWYNQFRRAGAQVGWAENYRDIIDREKKMINEIKRMRPGKARTIRRGLNSVLKFIENENSAVENAVRLSVFKNLIENKVPEAKAAYIAKELTVNFNRKGAMGQAMNSLYLFYNASVQGSTRLIYAATKSPKVRKLMAGTVAFAAALDIINRAIGGKDDDGEDRYDKIAPWIKERNMILMLPDDKGYAQIPLPWGYNIFHVMGQTAGEAITKKDFKPLDGAAQIAGATISSFNPVGGEASILQVLSPSLTDPIVQWAENKDWAGRKLRPDTNMFAQKPSSQTYWSSVREPSRAIAEKLNELTGGDVIKPGKIDISPEAIDLAINTFTGSAGKFVANLISTPIKAIKGEDIETYEVPIFRRLYGRTGKQALTSDFYENMDAVQLVYRQLKHYKDDKKKIEEIKTESIQEIRSIWAMKSAKRALKLLRKGKKLAMKIQNTQRRKKKFEAINGKIKAVMKNFNNRYKQQERED